MKKRIILTILLACLLTGCGQSTEVLEQEETNISEETTEEETEIIVSKEEARTYFEEVTVTTENWQDYFELAEEEYISKDAFDEPTGASELRLILKTKEENIIFNQGFAMRFLVDAVETKKSYLADTDELYEDRGATEYESEVDFTSFDFPNAWIATIRQIWEPYVNTIVDIELYEKWEKEIKSCELIKVAGTIFIPHIPENKWNIDVETQKRYIAIDLGADIAYLYEEHIGGSGMSVALKDILSD